MALTRDQLLKALLSGAEGSNPYAEGNEARRTAKLKAYLDGQQTAKEEGAVGPDGSYTPGTKASAQRAQQEYSISQAKQLEAQYMKAHPGFHGTFRVGPNGVEIAENQAVVRPNVMLTPAQESAEKEGGKKVADFEGGGSARQDSNIGNIENVKKEVEGGNRDWYDRHVGGALSGHETLMGLFAPSEKSRRDRINNSLLGVLKDNGFQRPTQLEIQQVYGQGYDPASDDSTNIQRMSSMIMKLHAQRDAAQKQADQYHKTGYVTIGQPASASPSAGAPQTPSAPPSQAPSAPQAAGAGGKMVRVKHVQSGQTGTIDLSNPKDAADLQAGVYQPMGQ